MIGAGPTGIAAAVRLTRTGTDHIVVDAFDQPGGMAGSFADDAGFVWDLGGHVIHSHFASFDEAVAASGTPMNDVLRNGWVWLDGEGPDSLLPAPIQAQLEELPEDLDPLAPAADLAEYYRNNYVIHETVQEYAGNPWLIRVTHDLHRILKMHRGRQLLTPGRMAQSLAEHRELMECFRRRDAEAAERTMNRHLLSQGQALAAYVAGGGMLNVPAPLPSRGGV